MPELAGIYASVAAMPRSLVGSHAHLQRLESALLSCVESLYRDRVMPTVAEVQSRLRSSGWHASEARAVLSLAVADRWRYKLTSPEGGDPPLILFRNQPQWFKGWVNTDASDVYSDAVWAELKCLVADPDLKLKGGIDRAAADLQQRASSPALRSLSLGELRHVLKLSMSPDRRILDFDAKHGGRLLPLVAPPKVAKASRRSRDGGGHGLADALRSRPLPEAWGRDQAELWHRQASVRHCMEKLYHDCVEPTLREVQQRLRQSGWSSQELQALPLLCAHSPEMFGIAEPTGDGGPLRVFLRDGLLPHPQAVSCWT